MSSPQEIPKTPATSEAGNSSPPKASTVGARRPTDTEEKYPEEKYPEEKYPERKEQDSGSSEEYSSGSEYSSDEDDHREAGAATKWSTVLHTDERMKRAARRISRALRKQSLTDAVRQKLQYALKSATAADITWEEPDANDDPAWDEKSTTKSFPTGCGTSGCRANALSGSLLCRPCGLLKDAGVASTPAARRAVRDRNDEKSKAKRATRTKEKVQRAAKQVEGKSVAAAIRSAPERPCMEFARSGQCSYGVACKFSHAAPVPGAKGPTEPKPASLCEDFAKGLCLMGEDCPSLHPSALPAAPATMDPPHADTSTAWFNPFFTGAVCHNPPPAPPHFPSFGAPLPGGGTGPTGPPGRGGGPPGGGAGGPGGPPPGPLAPGDFYRKRRDVYNNNNANPHLRELEPLPNAYRDYLVPDFALAGLPAGPLASGDVLSQHATKPLGQYLDFGTIRTVRLQHCVVDKMRSYFAKMPRDDLCSTYRQGMRQCVSLMVHLRVTPAEELEHEWFATLVAYCDRSYNPFLLAIGGQVWDSRWVAWLVARARMMTAMEWLSLLGTVVTAIRLIRPVTTRLVPGLAKTAFRTARMVVGSGSLASENFLPAEYSYDDVADALEQGWRWEVITPLLPLIGNLSPLLEECAKHAANGRRGGWVVSFLVTSVIIIKETLTSLDLVGVELRDSPADTPNVMEYATGIMFNRLGTHLMHIICANLPLPSAVAVHYVYNWGVFAQNLVSFTGATLYHQGLARGAAQLAAREAAALLPSAGAVAALAPWALGAVTLIAALTAGVAYLKRRVKSDPRGGHEPAGLLVDEALLFGSKRASGRPIRVFRGATQAPPAAPQDPEVVVTKKMEPLKCPSDLIDITRYELRTLPLRDQPNYVDLKGEGDPARGVSTFQCGFGVPRARPEAPADNPENVEAVVRNRVAQRVPTADPLVMADFMVFMMNARREMFVYPNGTPVGKVNMVSWEYAFANMKCSAQKLRRLRYVKDMLDREGINEHGNYSVSFLRKVANRHNAFVKDEKLCMTGEAGSKAKAYRPIITVEDIAQLMCCRWFMAWQGVMAKCWHKDFFITLDSGTITGDDIGRIVSDFFSDGWRLAEDDAGTWDMTMNEKGGNVNEVDVAVYASYGMPRGTIAIMQADRRPVIRFKNGWKIKKSKGQMISGRGDTFSGNSRRNGTAHFFIHCRANRLTPKEGKKTFRYVAKGDDGLALHHPGTMPDYEAGMTALGHKPELKIRDELHHAEYCSGTFFSSTQGARLTPLLGNVFARMPYFVGPAPRGESRESMARGAVLSMRASLSHIPPVVAMFDRILELTSGSKAYTPLDEPFRRGYESGAEATESTWWELSDRYGWNRTFQSELEADLKEMQLGDNFRDGHPVYLFIHRDVDAPSFYAKPANAYPAAKDGVVPFSSFSLKGAAARCVVRNMFGAVLPVVPRCGPEVDLTRYGVEPHPGPGIRIVQPVPPSSTVQVHFPAGTVAVASHELTNSADSEPQAFVAMQAVEEAARQQGPDWLDKPFIVATSDGNAVNSLASFVAYVPGGALFVEKIESLDGDAVGAAAVALAQRVVRAAHPTDLTTQGIEPNPGPGSTKKKTAKRALREAEKALKSKSHKKGGKHVRHETKKEHHASDARRMGNKLPGSNNINLPQLRTIRDPPATKAYKSVTDAETSRNAAMASKLWKSIERPFEIPAPLLGAAGGSVSYVNSYEQEYDISTTGTGVTGSMAMVLLPRGRESILRTTDLTLSGPGQWYPVPMRGDSAFVSTGVYSGGRLLCMGYDVAVRLPPGLSTTAPGRVHAGMLSNITATNDFNTGAIPGLAALQGVVELTGEDKYNFQVGSRPLDTNDGEFSTIIHSFSDYATTNIPFFMLSGWAGTGAKVVVKAIMQWEVTMKPTAYLGVATGIAFGEHDWSVITDMMRAMAGRAFGEVVRTGTAAAVKFAMGAASGLAAAVASGARSDAAKRARWESIIDEFGDGELTPEQERELVDKLDGDANGVLRHTELRTGVRLLADDGVPLSGPPTPIFRWVGNLADQSSEIADLRAQLAALAGVVARLPSTSRGRRRSEDGELVSRPASPAPPRPSALASPPAVSSSAFKRSVSSK